MTNKERTIFYQNCHNSTANIMQIISDSLWQKDPLTMQKYFMLQSEAPEAVWSEAFARLDGKI